MPCCGGEAKAVPAAVTRPPSTSGALVIIQARITSSRLPGKILALIGDKPLIQHVVERALAIPDVADVVIAVPQDGTKAALEKLNLGVVILAPNCPDHDVLCRYAAIARQFASHPIIVRLTADNPMIDPQEAGEVLAALCRSDGWSYHSNLVEGYQDGSDIEVFTRDFLLETDAALLLNDPRREHVTPAMGQPVIRITHRVKTSVDTQDDLERVRKMMAHE